MLVAKGVCAGLLRWPEAREDARVASADDARGPRAPVKGLLGPSRLAEQALAEVLRRCELLLGKAEDGVHLRSVARKDELVVSVAWGHGGLEGARRVDRSGQACLGHEGVGPYAALPLP